MKYIPAFMIVILSGSAWAAGPPVEMQLECQQNTNDGRILVANGDMLPQGARYRVKTYRPTKNTGDGWTTGSCVLVITRGASY